MTRTGANSRLTARIHGRVQMVGFRVYAELIVAQIERTEQAQITGWIRNLPDGSTVELVAEGPRASLDQLLDELRIGPPMAMVRQVDAEWSNAQANLEPFELTY